MVASGLVEGGQRLLGGLLPVGLLGQRPGQRGDEFLDLGLGGGQFTLGLLDRAGDLQGPRACGQAAVDPAGTHQIAVGGGGTQASDGRTPGPRTKPTYGSTSLRMWTSRIAFSRRPGIRSPFSAIVATAIAATRHHEPAVDEEREDREEDPLERRAADRHPEGRRPEDEEVQEDDEDEEDVDRVRHPFTSPAAACRRPERAGPDEELRHLHEPQARHDGLDDADADRHQNPGDEGEPVEVRVGRVEREDDAEEERREDEELHRRPVEDEGSRTPGPPWSRTITSWIIVSSRCVFGSSNGMRQFSARRTTAQLAATRTSGAPAVTQPGPEPSIPERESEPEIRAGAEGEAEEERRLGERRERDLPRCSHPLEGRARCRAPPTR